MSTWRHKAVKTPNGGGFLAGNNGHLKKCRHGFGPDSPGTEYGCPLGEAEAGAPDSYLLVRLLSSKRFDAIYSSIAAYEGHIPLCPFYMLTA